MTDFNNEYTESNIDRKSWKWFGIEKMSSPWDLEIKLKKFGIFLLRFYKWNKVRKWKSRFQFGVQSSDYVNNTFYDPDNDNNKFISQVNQFF